jgi:hypothetical protein
LVRRALVWLVGFLVTGKVADPPTAYELRRMPRASVAVGLLSLGAAVGTVSYLYALAPHGYLASALAWPVMIGGAFLLVVGVQATVARLSVRQSIREGRRRRKRRERRSDQ